MYGGKRIAAGDVIYLFASEQSGGCGLIGRGVVTSVAPVARPPAATRVTPRVSIAVRRTGKARDMLGRSELRPFAEWGDGRPQTELNFKFYRQATDKIAGISMVTAAFLDACIREEGSPERLP